MAAARFRHTFWMTEGVERAYYWTCDGMLKEWQDTSMALVDSVELILKLLNCC